MAEKTFESQMERLEEIVRQLEKGESSLNESIKLFEEGAKLSANLEKILDRAENKVMIMRESVDGELKEEPFTMEET